ncbi:Hsp70 protein-domain-containing protein [Chiua virens]|nr:Hsp70 protein-domain-containing protein [Chiua virens]
MPQNGSVPNGSASQTPPEASTPSVVGINFGNSYASIAVFTKEGVAECIANEDGERQIACVLAFHGEEMYIGNPSQAATCQKRSKHYYGFPKPSRKKVCRVPNLSSGICNKHAKMVRFSEVPQDKLSVSTPVIQHPSLPDTPAYKVKVLQHATSPLPATATNTPAASQVATPRSEPMEVERILTVSEVTTIFLGSLRQSAEDFLGRKVIGAVVAVPSWFDAAQREALSKAADDAGIHILQLFDDAGAIAVCDADSVDGIPNDRTQLIVDLGASSLELSLLSIREGLAYSLATLSDPTVGGDEIDSKLIRFFAKEFTKKTKTPLTVAPATEPQDKRAEAKLRLAVEHTKRTLSASPGAATCSVESLKDGLDYTGSINRLRFDMEVRAVYDRVYAKIKELAESAEIDLYDIDEIVYIGGSASLPGLDESLSHAFTESVITPFKAGTVVAHLLVSLARESSEELLAAFDKESKVTSIAATSRTIGLLVPQEDSAGSLGGIWIPLVLKETPLPCRRTLRFEVDASEAGAKVGFELWEVKEGVKIDHVKPPKIEEEEEAAKKRKKSSRK